MSMYLVFNWKFLTIITQVINSFVIVLDAALFATESRYYMDFYDNLKIPVPTVGTNYSKTS